MSNLSNDQLLLLDQLNHTRLALLKHFKAHVQPDPGSFLHELLKIEVLTMENKYKEHLKELSKENQANLSLLMDRLLVKKEEDRGLKKLSVRWKEESRDNPAPKLPKQQPKAVDYRGKGIFNQPPANTHKEPAFRQPQIPVAAKAVIPPGEFVAASILPKGTSVRKKFVPPYKKPDINLKEVDEKEEQDECKEPAFKNLEEKLVNLIMSEILEKGEEVKWSSIAGLGFAKKIIHEMIVWPMLRPDIFTGLRAPPRAILLFGPPGTGKTMIGKAIASEASATFFSISASSLTSKWVGESEKLVKTLFAIARAKQPSVIFIDEIDSLLSVRSEGEQESSRRVKTQFLVELDGAKTSNNERVLIIGATNLPHQLDDAVRRRFVKRLYIPLPNLQGRVQLIKNLTSNQAFRMTTHDIDSLALRTRGFSGADLYNLCSEAAMVPLRQMSQIENVRYSEVPCSELRHFQTALLLVRPSVNKKMLKNFQEFNQSYGSYQFTSDQLEEDQQKNGKPSEIR